MTDPDDDPMSAPSGLVARLRQAAERYGSTGAERGSEAFDAVWALIHEFDTLPGNGAGGKLHIVLDDGNLAEEHVVWCREEARKAGDEPAFWLAQVLLAFTDGDRRLMFDPFSCANCGENGYGVHACPQEA